MARRKKRARHIKSKEDEAYNSCMELYEHYVTFIKKERSKLRRILKLKYGVSDEELDEFLEK